ncbi:MAG TPA: hypothetical protein VE907_00845 [Gammaproteobacteria bacterium]|nr:hypothetical protein [Gammaproteobacteria bacterium]
MSSRSRPNIAAAVLALAALFGAPASFAQAAPETDRPATDRPAVDREAQLLETIEQESRNGRHAEGLVEPLSALALLYQDRDDTVRAVATIERLLEVIRANDGLHSLEQVEPIRQLIATMTALGARETAWNLEQDLLALARRHPDDLRTVPIFHESADKRLAVLHRYLTEQPPPEIELGCYRGWPHSAPGQLETANCKSGSKKDAARALIVDAQRNYAEAIAVILRHGDFSSPGLRELEADMVRTVDLARTDAGPLSLDRARPDQEPWRSSFDAIGRLATWPLPIPAGALPLEIGTPPPFHSTGMPGEHTGGFDYLLARESLKRQFHYEGASSASTEIQIEAFVRIADWDLLNSQNTIALDEYEQAYRLLEQRGDRASIERVFAPPIPVLLPWYSANPLSSEQAGASGYVDVAFGVTKFGASRQVEILDSTTNATDADKAQLVRLIKNSRFRPRATPEGWGRTSALVVRYYVTG